MKEIISHRISELAHNKEAKTLAGNFISLLLLKVAGLIFPLITLPYLSRVIGTEGFGAIAFAASIMVFIETITDWGFNYTATRDVAKQRENITEVSRIFSEVISAKVLIMTGCFILLCFATSYIPYLKNYRLLLLLTFAYIPGHILFPEWLFQAFERMKYITFLNVVSKTIFTILIFIIIKEPADYVFQPLLTACGYLVSGVLALYIIIFKFNVKFRIPSFQNMLCRLKDSSDMFLSLILPNFYTNFTTVILKTYCGNVSTGIYSGGQRFQQIVDQLSQVLSRTFFPFLARHKERHSVYVKISGGISILACIVLFLFANLFVRLFYTPEFEAAADVIRIFAITPFFLFLMNTYGTNYLVIVGKEKILKNIIIGCSLLGFGITWLITPCFGYIGAASTITIVWGIRGILTYYFARKIKRQNG